MTKILHVPEEGALRLQVSLDDAVKIDPSVPAIIDKNALAICSTHLNREKTSRIIKARLAIARNKAKTYPQKNRTGKIMHKLYDLEPCNEQEKQLDIDLGIDLYQMEEL